jgi:hypothetical protein
MANIFTLENINDFAEKINIDDLYEKKRQHDLNKLELFNKILNRVHVKIKTTARQRIDEQFCWFVVPEMIIGVPKYDQGACIAYIVDKLKDNGFAVRYIHPNTLFICWKHFVPSYVRTELKKKTGIEVDEYGRKVNKDGAEVPALTMPTAPTDPTESLFNLNKQGKNEKEKDKQFRPIQSYKPQGNFIYDDDLMNKLGNKL